MHHLEWAGRNALNMGAHLIKERHMTLVAALKSLFLNSVSNFVIAEFQAASAMRASMGQKGGLIGPKFRRRAHMRMAIYDLQGVLPVLL